MPLQDNILEQLKGLQADMAARQGQPGVDPNVQPEEQQLAPPAGAGGDLRRRIGSMDGQDIYAHDQPGLNEQGQGAVGLPLSAPASPGMRQAYAPLIPRADRQVVANPLTGILEAAPAQQAPTSPQNDPWVAQQVQNIEKSMDLLGQNQTLSPFQKQHALATKEQQIKQIDPQGIYRRGSPQSMMTKGQQWAGQNVFKDPGTGLVFFHNGREWKVHEPKQDQNEYHQKLLDIREQQHKELMAHRDAQLQEATTRHKMMLDELKTHHEGILKGMQAKLDAGQQSKESTAKALADKRSEHADFWKEYNALTHKVTGILTKKGVKPGEADTLPSATAVAEHLDQFYPHMRKRRWEIEDEAKKMAGEAAPAPPAATNQVSPYQQQGPPAPGQSAKDIASQVRQGLGLE